MDNGNVSAQTLGAIQTIEEAMAVLSNHDLLLYTARELNMPVAELRYELTAKI